MDSIKLYFLVLLNISCLAACDSQQKINRMHTWTLTEVFDLPSLNMDYKINQIKIISEQVGFIVGSDERRILPGEEPNACLFSSYNSGKSFKKSTLGKGTLQQLSISADKKHLYLIKTIEDKSDSNEKDSYILQSKDMGITWETIVNWRSINIEQIEFLNDSVGFILAGSHIQEKYHRTIYKTVDGGRNWNPINLDGDEIIALSIAGKDKLLLEAKSGLRKAMLLDINSLQTTTTMLYKYPDNFKALKSVTDETTNRHYLLVEDDKNQKAYLYCIETAVLTAIPNGKYFEFNVCGDYIAIFFRGSNSRSLYQYSNDFGKNWVLEAPTEPFNYDSPIGFYGKGYVWVINSFAVSKDKGEFLQIRKP